MHKLKILLWSPKGAGYHYYGPGKNALTLYQEIKKQANIEIILVHAYPNHEKLELYETMYEIGNYKKNKISDFFKYLIKAAKVLLKYRNKGYVFHGLDVYSNIFIPALIAKFLGYPVALKIAAHPSGLNSSNNKLILLFRRMTARFINKFLAISNEIVEELNNLKVCADKIELVYNGVAVPKNQKFGSDKIVNNPKILLFTGSVVERKRPHLLIEALAKSKNIDAWILKIVGPEDDLRYLDKMKLAVQNYGLENRVDFLGFKKDLSQYYSEADLYALPSLSEGMPNGVLEAMAYRLPLIISNFSSATLLCDNDNGYIADTVQEIANALDAFIENPNHLQIKGSKSYELIDRKFNLSKVAKSYIATFNEISS